MSNRKHRFRLTLVRRPVGTQAEVTYYLISTEKFEGNYGRLCNMAELEHAVKHGTARTRDFASTYLPGYFTFPWIQRTTNSVEYVGNFESIQDIIEIIKVLQL